MPRWIIATAVALLLAAHAPGAAAATKVRVIVPDPDNLQFMSFWVAKAAGFFEAEGILLELSIPTASAMAADLVRKKDAEVAVLAPPMYLRLISEKQPIMLVANLLQNDPINLVVRRSVMESKGLSASVPVLERLRGLRGLRVGVAPNPPTRLRALFAASGLDADKDIEMVIFHGRDQNQAFADDKVDALYAHTPYVEKALVDQDAVMLVNQSAGEIPELSTRQIHALVFQRSFIDRSPELVTAMTRAIRRAQELIHEDPRSAIAVLIREFPAMDPRHVEKIVTIYSPAIPRTPEVSVEGFARAIALFPASHPPPDFTGIDLADYVVPRFAAEVARAPSALPPRGGIPRVLFVLSAAAVAVLVVTALYVFLRRAARRAPA